MTNARTLEGPTRSALIVTFALTLLGCGVTGGDTGSPDGAVVRIHSAGDRVVLDPASVPCGTVHLESSNPGIALITASGEVEGAMGPLDDATLARVERGDFQDTVITGIEGAFGGPRFTVTLRPGRYAFAMLPDEADPTGLAPVSMSVLTVEEASRPSTQPDATNPPE